jgi:hypothetical protein
MLQNRAHEDGLHEDLHRGTVTLADELTIRKGASPLRRIKYVLSCYTGGFGVRLYFREQGSSHTSDDV